MKKISILFLIITGLLLYILTIRGVHGNPAPSSIKNNLDQASYPFELSPERGRYLLTYSLAEDKSFALSKMLADAAYPDIGYYGGRFYVFFAPGISVLALPTYYLGKMFNLAQVGAYFAIVLFAIGNLVMLFLISKNIFKLNTWISLLVPFIFGFASSSWSYAITLYQHHVTVFFLLSSFYAVWKYQSKTSLSWMYGLYVWLAYGLAVFLDYPNGLLLFPVMIYFLLSAFHLENNEKSMTFSLRSSIIFTSIIFVGLMCLHGYYNYVNFGGPLKLSGTIVGVKALNEHKALEKNDQKTIKELEDQKSVSGLFNGYNLPRGIAILLFSVDRGLLVYSPIFLLGIFGLFFKLKKYKMEKNILIMVIIIDFILYGSFGDPWGGWGYGPRYLIPSMAVLSIFTGIVLNAFEKNIYLKIVTLVLFIWSSAVGIVGAITTNAIPPKIEADYLHTGYNFLLNMSYMIHNISGSYVYKYFASNYVDLTTYFLIILSFTSIMAFSMLFIFPAVHNEH